MSSVAKKKIVSSALQRFMGSESPSLKEALKGVWTYVKKNNLQKEDNKQEFVCDEKLKSIFKKDSVHMHHVLKGLSTHYTKE